MTYEIEFSTDYFNDVYSIRAALASGLFDYDRERQYDALGDVIGNPKLLAWMQNRLSQHKNRRPILTDNQRELCKALAGPHGLTILKAIRAKRGVSLHD